MSEMMQIMLFALFGIALIIFLMGIVITRLARIERTQRILLSKLANERPPEDFGGI